MEDKLIKLGRLDELLELDPELFTDKHTTIITDNMKIATELAKLKVDERHPLYGALIILLDVTSGKLAKELH